MATAAGDIVGSRPWPEGKAIMSQTGIGPTVGRTAHSAADSQEPVGWGVTGAGIVLLTVTTTPFRYWAVALAGGCVLVIASVLVLRQGMAMRNGLAAHGLAGLVMSVLGSALALMLLLAQPEQVQPEQTSDETTTTAGLPDDQPEPEVPAPFTEQPEPDPDPSALTVAAVTASSTAPDSKDGAGQTVSFGTDNLTDQDTTTAWRTKGDGVGETLEFSFGNQITLESVGMIPGYAKSDPQTGLDRFAENRRILSAQLTFSDGTTRDISLQDSAEMQRFDIGLTTTSVTVTITDTTDDPKRNFTAVSEMEFVGW